MEEKKVSESAVYYGNDNIFADIGLPNADELLAKAELASAISQAIEERGLTQMQAAEAMGVDQPKVSKIIRGRLGEFSTERLLTFLIRLGLDVEIVIHRNSGKAPGKRAGAISVAYL